MRVQAKFPSEPFSANRAKNRAKTALYMYCAVLITGLPGIEKTNECVFVREIGGVRAGGDER
jgi:hypothetical protein